MLKNRLELTFFNTNFIYFRLLEVKTIDIAIVLKLQYLSLTIKIHNNRDYLIMRINYLLACNAAHER